MKPVAIGDGTDLRESAIQFRGVSNLLPFMSGEYNEVGVKTTTPKDRQVIFMDAMFNAQFDVKVLASAFNMNKADFMGRLFLIDNWTSFDNERFDIIRANSDGIEEVTSEELALLADVKAVILDANWFQVYDNNNKFTEKYSASGLYWNYFYHTWKTISNSPFSNAVVFVTSTETITAPETVTVEISSKDIADVGTVFVLEVQEDNATLQNGFYEFVQTEDATTKGIAIQKYGAVTFPVGQTTTMLQMIYGGVAYTATTELTTDANVGATLTFSKS